MVKLPVSIEDHFNNTCILSRMNITELHGQQAIFLSKPFPYEIFSRNKNHETKILKSKWLENSYGNNRERVKLTAFTQKGLRKKKDRFCVYKLLMRFYVFRFFSVYLFWLNELDHCCSSR